MTTCYISKTFITAYLNAPSAIPPLSIAVKESFRRLRLSPLMSATSTPKSLRIAPKTPMEQSQQRLSDKIGEKGA